MKVLKIAGIAVALIAGFYAPTLIKHFSSPPELTSLDEYCLLSTQTCVQDDVSMTLSVDTAQPLIPAKIEVNWTDNGADQLVLSLVGREMDMGKPTFILKRVSSGKFVGDITLPVCTHGSMTWLGELSDGTNTLNPAIKMQR
ncbi:hypothetical protein D1115_21905 [Vibrio alfacsensis]|uniref:Uncharacterized protein n=1 Tax=Vibrio alfacsensis TaxID=1074311 RepID=A0ABM6Z040_9VIBR|nr:hypothetical protein [Vibrio alfacsensis]AXY03504.1 hypothetical protein D1115_21905 [Vibrio alfacsensis]